MSAEPSWLELCRVQPRFNKVKGSTPEDRDGGQVRVPKSNKVQHISGQKPVPVPLDYMETNTARNQQ